MAQGYAGVPAGPLSAYLGVREANRKAGLDEMEGLLAYKGQLAKMQAIQEQQRLREQLAADAIKSREAMAASNLEAKREGLQLQGQQRLDLERQRAADREALARLAAGLRAPPQPAVPQPPIVQTDEQGNTRIYDRSGNLIKELGKTGKPSAQVMNEQLARAKMHRDLALIIPTLEEISKDKGLLDKATGSGIGAGVDIAAGVFGYATPGAIAIGQLKPMTDAVLKLVPRFEGPQSDKDTKSYQDAAGNLANPNTPNETKKAAAKTILKLYQERQGQFITKDYEAATGGAPTGNPKVIDFSKLPK